MNSRRFLIVVAGGCFWIPALLTADDGAPPFAMDKSFSADVTITTKNGTNIQTKVDSDGDKMRSETTMNGMAMVTILRKDTQKIYEVMTAQKVVMEMDYDPSKFGGFSGADSASAPEGKYELVGPESIDGVACTKYTVTSDKTKQVFYFWLDLARKIPVQMAAADGSLMVKWKNYQAGPQDESLFEIPEGYQVMPMPNLPGISGGGGQ